LLVFFALFFAGAKKKTKNPAQYLDNLFFPQPLILEENLT